MPLQRTAKIQDVDGIYNALVEAHRGLESGDSAALNARLVLLLANHIGEEAVIREAIDIARRPPRSKD